MNFDPKLRTIRKVDHKIRMHLINEIFRGPRVRDLTSSLSQLLHSFLQPRFILEDAEARPIVDFGAVLFGESADRETALHFTDTECRKKSSIVVRIQFEVMSFTSGTCPADSSCFQELLIKNTGALPAQFTLRQGETSPPEFRLNDATVILEEDPPDTAVDGDAAASSGDAAATSGDAVATPGDGDAADADAADVADVADAADAGEVVCIKINMNEVGAI